MDNPIIYWVIGGLLILFFFYLTYQFTKTWRVWHVIVAFMVFGAVIALSIYVSLTVRTHTVWKQRVHEETQKVEERTKERDLMLYGNRAEPVQAEPTIRSLNAKLGRVLIDRGRVWRQCVPSPFAKDGSVTVSTVPPGVAQADASANQIEENTILYVFAEKEAPPEENLPPGTTVPRFYLGEFAAAAVTDFNVTLKPTFPVFPPNDYERILLGQQQTWAIYEAMPADGHRFFFAEDPDFQPDLRLPVTEDDPIFGQRDPILMGRLFPSPQQFQGIVPDALLQTLQAAYGERYLQMLRPYGRDGGPKEDGDSPDNVWLRVRFTQSHTEEVDTAGEPVDVINSQNFFDNGRAEVALLRRGADAVFKPGDFGLFPQGRANELISREQVAELEDEVYLRTLNDYESSFRDIAQRLVKLAEDIRQVKRDTAEVTKANELALQQISIREDERDKLGADLKRFNYERDQITQYAATLETKWSDTKVELSRIYNANLGLVEELDRLNEALTGEINRRTEKAVEDAD